MSGVLKVVGKIASVIALIPSPIQPIAAAVAVVASVAGGLLSSSAHPPIEGSTTSLTIGADQPTPYMIGDTYSGGALVHQVGYGEPINKVPNPYLAMAVVHSAGGPIAGIDTYYADFDPVTFSGDEATGYFSEILFRQSSLGPMLQSTALTGPWGAIPQWGSDAKLSGLAHTLWSLKWDSKNGKYTSGAPQLGVRGRGVLTWDPREDDTQPGGMGDQRWADPADTAAFDAARDTWAYTYRPGLHALRYALGTWERDLNNADSKYVLTFGLGFRLDQIVVEDFVELENVCEANGWEVSGILLEPGDKAANMKRILEAGGAEIAWKGGKLGLKIRSPRVSLDTISRDDLAGGDLRGQSGTAWRDRINAVIPKFTSPDHKWTLQQSAKITVPEWITEDGEEKLQEEPFQFVKQTDQAAQLATYRLFDSREFGPVDIPIGPRLRGYHGGDRLTLDDTIVDELGYPHGEVVVLQRAFDPTTMTGVLTVMGETASKHALCLAQTGTVPAAIVIPTAEERDGVDAPVRAAYSFIDRTVAYPVTSDDTSISIAGFSGTLNDGTEVTLPAGRRTGLTGGADYAVFYVIGAAATAPAAFDLTAASLPTGATLTRASAGTRVNSSGALVSASTDVARFDYDPTTLALRGMLYEATAVTAILQSQDISNANWTKTNATAGSAVRLVESSAGSGSVSHQITQTQSGTSGHTYTYSTDGKLGVGTRYLVLLLPSAIFGSTLSAKFDLTNGTVITGATSVGATAAISVGPGGYYRCSITATATATASGSVICRMHNANTTATGSYTGDGTSAIDVTNFQFEEGTKTSSRIATTTTSVTRAADVLTLDWGSLTVADGAVTLTVTFDDGSTQTRTATVASGTAVLTTTLNRPRIRSITAPLPGSDYVAVPAASASTYFASDDYIFIDRQRTSLGGVFDVDPDPPPGRVSPGSGGGPLP